VDPFPLSLEIKADEDSLLVAYEGAVERLAGKPERSDTAFLRFWAKLAARQLGAEVMISEEGNYDWWAD